MGNLGISFVLLYRGLLTLNDLLGRAGYGASLEGMVSIISS